MGSPPTVATNPEWQLYLMNSRMSSASNLPTLPVPVQTPLHSLVRRASGTAQADMSPSPNLPISPIYQMSSCNPVTNPCAVDFLATDSDSPLCDAHTYLSLCMALMYLARISRPDILFPVTYLATKSSRPTIFSFNKLQRILR